MLDEHEQKAIEMFINQTNPSGEKKFWIGLTDLAHEGSWVWLSSGKPAEYTNWLGNNPDNAGKSEHFAHMVNSTYSRRWNDCANDDGIGFCSLGSFALCQFVL